MLDVERETADRGPVATCILQQRLGLGYPHVLAAPAQPLVEDDGGNLTALAGTGAVAKEESGPVRATVLVRRERQPFLGRLEQTGDVALESVTGVGQRFRSEGRRRGKEGVRTCSSRGSPSHYKKKTSIDREASTR